MRLFRLFSTLLFQAFLFTNLGFLGCGSTPTNQEIIQEYITKCFAEDSVYRRTVEEAYKNDSRLGPSLEKIDIYTGSGSADTEKAHYVQSLSDKQLVCAFRSSFKLFGQSCTEIAYVDHSQKVSYEDHSRKCE